MQDVNVEPQLDIAVALLDGQSAPMVGSSGRAVSEIVHACHQRTVDEGLAELAIPGLNRETLDGLLTYCAEVRCEAVSATCPGCKKRTEAQGIPFARRLHCAA